MKHIVTLTMNPAIDASVSVARVVPERKLRGSQPRFDPGGGGINVSRAIAYLGGRSTAFYTSGQAHGRWLEALLDDEGLDHRPLRIGGHTRESLTVDETSSGQQYRFGTPGPSLRPEEWERCRASVEDLDPPPDYLVVSGSLPPGGPEDFHARLARYARRAGVRMVLDASGPSFRRAVAEGVFLIKPNLREFRALAGGDLEEEAAQVAAAEGLVARDQSAIVVVSLGAAGALMVGPDGARRLRAPTVPIRSKVGAGDSMVAGIVTALARGAEPVEAVQYGVAAGAAAVMTPGTRLCRREDTDNLFRQIAEDRGGPA